MTTRQAEFYVSPWAATHDTRFWNEPYAFRPERWIDPTCPDVKAASQPFSLGPRVCPGKLYVTPHRPYPAFFFVVFFFGSFGRAVQHRYSLRTNLAAVPSFAFGQMSLQLAKIVYAHDMELVDKGLDWIDTCQMHFLWWKPELNVRFTPRAG